MPNMKQIAAKAGVSLGTVSHVINGSANVREPLRKRVLDAVAAIGYQPSQLARGLRRVKTNMIGMIIPDVTNPFFPAVVRGAEDVAFANGYRLVLCNTDNDHAKELVHLQELRTYLPAGLIVIPSNFSDLSAQAESYRKAGSAVVCVDRLPRDWSGDTVTVANESGAYQATKYLILTQSPTTWPPSPDRCTSPTRRKDWLDSSGPFVKPKSNWLPNIFWKPRLTNLAATRRLEFS